MRCPSCAAVSINGIACHETGCPDRRLILLGPNAGLYLHTCFECGCDVESEDRGGYNCDCTSHLEDDTEATDENTPGGVSQ